MWKIICENCLVSEKVRYEEVKSSNPSLPKSSFLPYLPTLHHFFPFPFTSLHSPYILLTSLPSISIPYLSCPFCGPLIHIFVVPFQPSSFPINLPISVAILFLPTFLFPTLPLPYSSPSLPTLLLPSPPISFPPYPSPSLPTHLLPSPPISFPPYPSCSLAPYLPTSLPI